MPEGLLNSRSSLFIQITKSQLFIHLVFSVLSCDLSMIFSVMARVSTRSQTPSSAHTEAENVDEEAGKFDEENPDARENMIQDSDDDDDHDSQPLQPEKLFFAPIEYGKACKIGTRCTVRQTVEYIKNFPAELKWFRNHSQFKHIFHMPMEPNHMIQGMWMLLLRTACTEMQRECWFVVNGVPIRYSMREHALLTGFACHEYPNNYMELGDLKFVKRVFGRCDEIKIKDVKEKLEEMKSRCCTDRKKLAILYFLCKVVKAKSKANGNIDSFLLSVVDDVNACENFPWGRYTFDGCMQGIRRLMKNMKGSVKPKAQTGFSGFIVPLEILAFECVPHLGRTFREAVPADKECPRMCKHKFTIEGCMKGFPLEAINKALGSTKEILSILEPDSDEKALLARILDDDVDDGIGERDLIVDSWRERLIVQRKCILWKDLYKLDLGSRSILQIENVDVVPEKLENVSEVPASVISLLKEAMDKGFERMVEKLDEIDVNVVRAVEKLGELDVRVKDLQNFVVYSQVPGNTRSPPPNTLILFPYSEKGEEEDVQQMEVKDKGNKRKEKENEKEQEEYGEEMKEKRQSKRLKNHNQG